MSKWWFLSHNSQWIIVLDFDLLIKRLILNTNFYKCHCRSILPTTSAKMLVPTVRKIPTSGNSFQSKKFLLLSSLPLLFESIKRVPRQKPTNSKHISISRSSKQKKPGAREMEPSKASSSWSETLLHFTQGSKGYRSFSIDVDSRAPDSWVNLEIARFPRWTHRRADVARFGIVLPPELAIESSASQ